MENAKKKSSNKKFIDKVDFLEYLITKDESILKLLSSSKDFNFYSYYANELLGNKINEDFKIDSLNEFKTILKSSNSKTIALLYAIAKNQSNLEIDKVSKDFRVGIMQLKPVWIKDLSKEYNFNSFFNMEDSLNYAKAYLESLNIKTNNNLLSILFKYNKEVKNLDQITALSAIKKDDLLTSYIKLFPLLEGNENYLLWYTLAYNKLDKKSKERLELNTIWENL
ncbi:transglycosylase SLT domain-containing protein [Halarcobacter anaerophilus]|uniref:transglycosylase SLT domain-containing protein n=1 Tax=Halarcobacter anaerophilus TaxID=877500 RepID=UPI0005C93A29|nr:transglycosylase SLT domain-containing protein [Halarcobacter anaerophilus]